MGHDGNHHPGRCPSAAVPRPVDLVVTSLLTTACGPTSAEQTHYVGQIGVTDTE